MSLIHCWEGTATAANPAVVAPGYPRAELSLILALHRKSFNSSVIYLLFIYFFFMMTMNVAVCQVQMSGAFSLGHI